MNQPGFYVYYDQIDILSSLNDEQFGRIIRAQAEYSRNGEITDFSGDGQMQMAFEVVKNKTDLFMANSSLISEQQRLRLWRFFLRYKSWQSISLMLNRL